MMTSQDGWCPELVELGYHEDMPKPCNMAIQATIASIRAREVHEVILEHENESLSGHTEHTPSQFLMISLGIEEWVSIHHLAETQGSEQALRQIDMFVAKLASLEDEDTDALMAAQDQIVAIENALMLVDMQDNARKGMNNYSGLSSYSPAACESLVSPFSSESSASAPGTPGELNDRTQESSIFDVGWFTPEEMQVLYPNGYPSTPACVTPLDSVWSGETFVPAFPPRYLEWEVSMAGSAMWCIPNLNNLAPMSVNMWVTWGVISKAEVQECRRSALQGITRSDKPPVFISSWPPSAFGARFKCNVAVGARIRGPLATNDDKVSNHKSKLWNWNRPFFRCSCYTCSGKLFWFDHAIWYMVNHLEEFFYATTIQGRLMLLVKFLRDEARKMVLDHIAFMMLRQYMLDGAMELVNHPEKDFFQQMESSRALRIVEELLKPIAFTISKKTKGAQGSKTINLNAGPQAVGKRKSRI